MLREGPFERLWIQPAAGDAGGALGVAKLVWHKYLQNERPARTRDEMSAALLGPSFSDDEIEKLIEAKGAVAEKLEGDALYERVADVLANEQVVGWFQDRMEFGPRALGARSILGDPRSPKMQKVLNLKIKFRESFRPFAPIVLRERVSDYFELDQESPYMLIVAPVREDRRMTLSADDAGKSGIDLLNVPRSDIPAVTHVDYSARIQTVDESNPKLQALLRAFEIKSGCGVLVNTSFNVRGEPIVCTPEDAWRCFMRTHMDYLVLGSWVLEKTAQPEPTEDLSPGPLELD